MKQGFEKAKGYEFVNLPQKIKDHRQDITLKALLML